MSNFGPNGQQFPGFGQVRPQAAQPGGPPGPIGPPRFPGGVRPGPVNGNSGPPGPPINNSLSRPPFMGGPPTPRPTGPPIGPPSLGTPSVKPMNPPTPINNSSGVSGPPVRPPVLNGVNNSASLNGPLPPQPIVNGIMPPSSNSIVNGGHPSSMNGPPQPTPAVPNSSTFSRRYPPTQPGLPPPVSSQPPSFPGPPVSMHQTPANNNMPPLPPQTTYGMPPTPNVSGNALPPTNHGMPPPPATNSQLMPPPVNGIPPSFNNQGMPPLQNNNGMPPPPSSHGMPPPPNSHGMPPPLNNHGMPPMPNNSGMPPLPGNNQPQTQNKYGQDSLSRSLGGLSVTQSGFQKMWGQESVDLLQNRHILPPDPIKPPIARLQAEQWSNINCSPDIFRSTLTKIPETDALLKKSRLPLGVLIHPFKDLSHLPVIQCTTIVRCRSCRTYINPFVHFVDQRRWRCNLCYRVNELPEEFLYDPVSKTYGDPSRRPECKSSTIEFIAPQEYMLRPPQPAVYLFLLDVSRQALETGYLRNFCDTLAEELDKLPGDSRTQVGFITYHRTLQFYQIVEGSAQPTQLIVADIDDVFLPSPTDLLANLQNCKEQIANMLTDLPELFNGSPETDSCLGAALQAAYKMIYNTGGRITVVQSSLPNVGPGGLKSRDISGTNDKTESALLNPSTDFYKKLALDCSGQQIAVDLFVLHNQHCDLATISGISKFSGGQVQTFAGFHSTHNPSVAERFDRALRRYLTRKIGFEAVMRIRCTRGMSLHTFHGHFFVRSTDLLSLPNVNPDSGFGMQVAIEEDLKDCREVSFQAALLYTSSKGERRIRVHTLCIPTSASLQEVIQSADQQCIVGLLSKMAVDRTLNTNLADAREAFINVCVDTIERWKMLQCINQPGVLPTSTALKLLPLLVLSLLKSAAFTTRPGVKLDERSASLIMMKCLPLSQLIQSLYPDMYRVDQLELARTKEDEDGQIVPLPDRLQLSAEHTASNGAYLIDTGDQLILFLGKVLQPFFCEKIFGVTKPVDVDENLTDIPELDNEDSERFRVFIQYLNSFKPYPVNVTIVRDDSKSRMNFIKNLIDDRSEASYSYYEFLQHLKTQIK